LVTAIPAPSTTAPPPRSTVRLVIDDMILHSHGSGPLGVGGRHDIRIRSHLPASTGWWVVRAAGPCKPVSPSACARCGAREHVAPAGGGCQGPAILRPRPHIATIALMKRDDARSLILREWSRWRNEHLSLGQRADGADARVFYDHLRRAHPDLLDFPFDDDRWQTVHAWLLSPGAVSD